ncbi:MAG: type II toxin-antitoxin system RelB/DinJ family antitoxin [Lachnospiraceae bacterium]|nr:type II toxin-antitoxin system RelB/DinJ family antitoxin [Lachnospiraceae bacterium]
MMTANLQTKIDENQKKKADDLFKRLGTSTNEAIRIFIAKALEVGGFPFDLQIEEVPTEETLQAFREADEIALDINRQHYNASDKEKFFEDLRS